MASLSQMLAANNAAVRAHKEFEELLNADFALLRATQELLSHVRDMKRDFRPRQEAHASIVNFKDELAALMEKYGVELVPSAIYVELMDLRIIGTETRVGQGLPVMSMMTDTLPDPVLSDNYHNMQKVMDDAKQLAEECCGARAAAGATLAGQKNWPFPKSGGTPFKPGCI